jgi:uncharacterized protein DUF3592
VAANLDRVIDAFSYRLPNPVRRAAFLAVAGSLMVGGALSAWSTSSFRAQAQRADGVVVRYEAGPAHVLIEFRTASGKMVSFPASPLGHYALGAQVPVIYDPKDPELTHEIDSPASVWVDTFILIAAGLACLVSALSIPSGKPPS